MNSIGGGLHELLNLTTGIRDFFFVHSPAIPTLLSVCGKAILTEKIPSFDEVFPWSDGFTAAISSLEGSSRGKELDGIAIRREGLLAFTDKVLAGRPLWSFVWADIISNGQVSQDE